MKKVLLVLAAVAVAAGANAQSFSYGVKAGANMANVTEAEGKQRLGFHAGLVGEYTINDFVGVQAELLYSQQGDMDKQGKAKAVTQLDYITLPVLAKLSLVENLTLDLGPQFGYLMSSKLKLSGAPAGNGTTDIKNLNNLDVAFAAGLSYRFLGNCDVSARYNLGLNKIPKKEDGKNNVLAVSVGYRF